MWFSQGLGGWKQTQKEDAKIKGQVLRAYLNSSELAVPFGV